MAPTGWPVRRPISGKATRFPEIVVRHQRPERVEQVPEISRRCDVVLIHPRRPSDELCSSRRSRSKARATLTRASPFLETHQSTIHRHQGNEPPVITPEHGGDSTRSTAGPTPRRSIDSPTASHDGATPMTSSPGDSPSQRPPHRRPILRTNHRAKLQHAAPPPPVRDAHCDTPTQQPTAPV